MDKCFSFTFFDIQKIKPKLLVALGDSALYQATGRTGISHNRKKLLWSDKLKVKVLATYHPAAVLYDPSRWNDLVEDFKLIPQYINAEPFAHKNFEYGVVDTREKAIALFEENKGKLIYFDSEFTGLDIFKEEIRIVQFTYEGLDKIYLLEKDFIKSIENELKEVFNTSPVTGQDFAIDAKMIYTHHGIFPKTWAWDTCLAEYVLEGTGGNDLDSLVGRYVPEYFGYSDEVNKAGAGHKVKDRKTLYQYGANDVGVQFVKDHQEADGSWYGRWGVNYIYGTWQVLGGMRAINLDMNQPWLRRGRDWLERVQRPDGGWGERCNTYDDPVFKGQGPSTAYQTAWAVMGLCAFDNPNRTSIKRGIDYLVRTQNSDGSWTEDETTGTGFPKVVYLKYDMYRNAWPLLALAAYRKLKQAAARPDKINGSEYPLQEPAPSRLQTVSSR